MNGGPTITIKGIVIAADWDPSGDVSAVDIAGYDEKRYRVADNPMALQMRRYIRKSVVVQGRLSIDNHRNLIVVEDFRLDEADRGHDHLE